MIALLLKVGSDKSVDMSCDAQTLLSGNDELVSPNLECSIATTNFKNSKKNISTFNIRSGREDWKIRNLSKLIED